MEKIKIIVPFRSYLKRNRKFKKNSKKFNKLKDTVMASFQAKIGWKRPRKRKNKNFLSVSFLPDRKYKIPKKEKKKSKNTIVASFQAKNRLKKAEERRK